MSCMHGKNLITTVGRNTKGYARSDVVHHRFRHPNSLCAKSNCSSKGSNSPFEGVSPTTTFASILRLIGLGNAINTPLQYREKPCASAMRSTCLATEEFM